jgi:hypothetical protein
MNGTCKIRQGLFDRWYLFRPGRPYGEEQAWSGMTWVPASEFGQPLGRAQVCNFSTREEAIEYCREHGLDAA